LRLLVDHLLLDQGVGLFPFLGRRLIILGNAVEPQTPKGSNSLATLDCCP
jgi:hypothetical protein